jgi:hypothetical protein
MTNAEAITLGQRALAAGFVMDDGVRLVGGRARVLVLREASEDGPRELTLGPGYVDDYVWEPRSGDVPDFRDAASLGVLEAQVRERYAPAVLYVFPEDEAGNAWRVYRLAGKYAHDSADSVPDGWPDPVPASRAEAWVAALEARP